jgi:hypothetical protein
MSFEEQLVNEINEFRTNPKAYAKKVEKYISYFKGKTMIIPGSKAGMKTEEGAEPFKEAVDVLSKTEPVEPLEPSKGLERIAKDFLAEVLKVDPNELNNINVDDIMQKYGSFLGSMNREVDMGNETPEQVVMSLIASDGDQTRSHRECLLSTDLKKIGVANGKHPTYRHCTIIFFCTKFTNNVDKDDHGYINGSSTVTEEKKVEGQTLKPKKVVLKKEEPEVVENDEEARDDVVSETRNEKIVIENGKKKRVIKITRTLKDGSKEVETLKEAVEEE